MTPISPIDSGSLSAAYAPARTESRSVSGSSVASDIISISEEAERKYQTEKANREMLLAANKEADGDNAVWKLSSGLKEGTFNLKNGNVQKVSLEGNSLTLEEFKDGRLVKSVTGTVSETGAVLDTEYYDGAGKVSQSIHTEITKGDTVEGWTASRMTRQIKWFDGGKLKGEMQDNMLLQTENSTADGDDDVVALLKGMVKDGTAAIDTDVENLANQLTLERHALDYFAQIREYGESGMIARDMTIEQEGEYKQASNRLSKKIAGMEGRTTREVGRDTGLKIEVKDYDEKGELLREARFSDDEDIKVSKLTMSATPVQRQSVDVSWYNDGELVKRSHGSMELEAAKNARLPDRPGFLEIFGLEENDYLGDSPQSATDLMAKKIMTSSAEADFFLGGFTDHVNANDYSYADKLAAYGEGKRPYSISWTDEIYKDGELALRQSDSASARKSSFYQQERGIHFRTGGALTENDSPSLLRESSHEREVYEEGRLTSHQSMEARESVHVDEDGPDQLRTWAEYRQGLEGSVDTTFINGVGGIMQYDRMFKSAARGISTEIETTLGAAYDTITHLNRGETDRHLDYRVRPFFGK